MLCMEKENDRNNSPLLPKDIRGLIVGKRNWGKTTLILNLLLKPGWLDYDHLFVFGRSLHQREYAILKKGLESGLSKEQISNLFQNQGDINQVDFLLTLKVADVKHVKEMELLHTKCIFCQMFIFNVTNVKALDTTGKLWKLSLKIKVLLMF